MGEGGEGSVLRFCIRFWLERGSYCLIFKNNCALQNLLEQSNSNNILKTFTVDISLVSFCLVWIGLNGLLGLNGSLIHWLFIQGKESWETWPPTSAWSYCQISSSFSKRQEQSRRRQKKRGNGKAKITGLLFLGQFKKPRAALTSRASTCRGTKRPSRGHGLLTNIPAPLSLSWGYKGAQNLAQRNYLKPFRNKKSCMKLNLCYW